MSYSAETLVKMEELYGSIARKKDDLALSFLQIETQNEKTIEYIRHGYLRRLGTIKHCIDSVFRCLPPDKKEPPDSEDLVAATIALQGHFFHTYGILDNLAHIWVAERNIARRNGNPLSRKEISITANTGLVFESFSQAFQLKISEMQGWFEYLESFRHALAHRIPPYIPPYEILPENHEKHDDLEKTKWLKENRSNPERFSLLDSEQKKLGVAPTRMAHSFSENKNIAYFHSQMLIDFITIEDISNSFLNEIYEVE